MSTTLCFIFVCILSSTVFSQTDYLSGNAAYNAEFKLGFNPVTINGGSNIYVYDHTHNLYRYNNQILIPDMEEIIDGHVILEDTFFGFDIGGTQNENNFQWDNQTMVTSSPFDQTNLFVSPVSLDKYSYGKTVQFTNDTCFYDDCLSIIDGPDSTLVYSQFAPYSGTYELWLGEELIDAGDLKGTGTAQKISQQQSDTTDNSGYCPKTYGPGWRLPTDIEAGHINDLEGAGNGLDEAYLGNDSVSYIWTSSLFKIYNVKRWTYRTSDGTWENCAGFLYVTNKVRCVYHSGDMTTQYEPRSTHLNSRIYPNPAKEKVRVYFSGENINAKIEIIDLNGSVIHSGMYSEDTAEIQIPAASAGIYFVRIINNGQVETHKLVVD